MFKPNDAYLLGYYGKRNAGDDALLYASAWAAKHYLNCKKIKVSVFGESQHDHLAEPLNPTFFRGHERLQHYKVAITSKRLIIGGGSVFHTERDIQLKRHLIGLTNRNKSLAVGVSIGPFDNVATEKACQGFLNEVGFIGVRDQESYDIARSLAPKAHVKLTFDLAPALLQQQPKLTEQHPRAGIAVNFCQVATDAFGNTDTNAEELRIERACELISNCWQQTGEHVSLLDFNNHNEFGDHLVHQKIMARLASHIPVSHIRYSNDPIGLLKLTGTFKAMIGMRLHATIFSYLTETPTVALQYHNKCKNWSEQILHPEQYQFDANDFDPLYVTSSLTKGLNVKDMKAHLAVDTAVQRSLSNWSTSHDTYTVFNRNTALQQA